MGQGLGSDYDFEHIHPHGLWEEELYTNSSSGIVHLLLAVSSVVCWVAVCFQDMWSPTQHLSMSFYHFIVKPNGK